MCVGTSNYNVYFGLMNSVTLVSAMFSAEAWACAWRLHEDAEETHLQHKLFWLGLFWIPLVGVTGHIVLFHCMLIYRGITTYEYWKAKPTQIKNRRDLDDDDRDTGATSLAEFGGNYDDQEHFGSYRSR
jgi:hypothetical protein